MSVSIFIAAMVLLALINYFHYSPPALEAAEIERLAKVQLEIEFPDILSCSRHIKEEQVKACTFEVLDIREADKRTYLVFKADYQLKEPQKDYLSNKRYILGFRLVEKKLGGIALKGGAEFEVKYTGFYPADCGRHDKGIFYGFCKDPRVSKVILRSNDFTCEQEIKNRVIFAAIPAGRDEVYPEFRDNRGQPIQSTNAMRVALIGGNSQILQQYDNQPFTAWIQDLDEIDYLTPGTADAVWVFPDERPSALPEACLARLKELINAGIPIILMGEKNPRNAAGIFQAESSCDGVNDPEAVAAVFIASNEEGIPRIGVISREEDMEFPILQKTLALRYRLGVFEAETEVSQGKGTGITP